MYVPYPPVAPDRHEYRHDGFYLRMGLGIGFGHASTKGTVDGDSVGATYTGWGSAYEILIGGTVGHAFVIGGGFVGQDIWSPKVNLSVQGNPALSSQFSLSGALGVGALGPFVDWFPDETGGFHAGLMVGLGIIGLSGDTSFAGSLWAGYDFWIAREWSLGAELRAAGATGSRSLAEGDAHFDDSAGTLELLFTALYN